MAFPPTVAENKIRTFSFTLLFYYTLSHFPFFYLRTHDSKKVMKLFFVGGGSVMCHNYAFRAYVV